MTGNCADGSAVTGLSGNAGSLVDNVVLACNTVNPDGTVGESTPSVGPLGGSGGSVAAPIACIASFANGVQGKTGDDVDAIGLQCAQVSLTPPNLAGDEFGWAVDIDGDRMVASAPFAEVGGIDRAGKVYVYARGEDGVWVLRDVVTSPAPEVGGAFGDSLALNGNRLAVGESDRVSGLQEPGRVWVFERGDSGWLQLGGPIAAAAPGSGPVPGPTAPIATPGVEQNVFRVTFICKAIEGGDIANDLGSNVTWAPGDYVWRVRSGPNETPLAFEVRVGGGAPLFAGELGPEETQFFSTSAPFGGASVFWAGGSKGTASANETPCGVPASQPDAFGASLAWLGDSLVIGAPEAADGAGAVYITAFAGGTWSPPASLQTTAGSAPMPGDGDALGYSIDAATSAAGSFIVAGAPGDDNETGQNAGAVHIWRETEGGFDPAEKVTSGADWLAADAVGSAVAVDGNVIAAAGLAGSGTGAPLTVRTIDIPLEGSATSGWSVRENLAVGVNRGPNDYVDIEDGTLIYRRPGDGSQIEIFQDSGDGFGTSSTSQFTPTDRNFGDRIGFGLELEGLTVIAGAPGDDPPPNSGSVYSFAVPEPIPPAVFSEFSIAPSSGETVFDIGVTTIDTASLPASATTGFGGQTDGIVPSDLQTLDLRSDLGADESGVTAVADVTLGDLALDQSPITRELLDGILLAEIPLDGGWSELLNPGGDLLVETTITLLDIYRPPTGLTAVPPATLQSVRLGDLNLQANNLGTISTYAALLARVPAVDFPLVGGLDPAAYWSSKITDAGLPIGDFRDISQVTLPELSFAGVDIETPELLGSVIGSGTGQIAPGDLIGTPIGDRALADLDLGGIPLAVQPFVPSKALPSFLPDTFVNPDTIDAGLAAVTLGDLDQSDATRGSAVPLAAIEPVNVGLTGTLLADLDIVEPPTSPRSPLTDYIWAQPSVGQSLLIASGDPLDPTSTTPDPLDDDVANIAIDAFGLDAPVLAVPLDEITVGTRPLGDFTLGELTGAVATAPFGVSPFGVSPFGVSPFGVSPFGVSPFGVSPFGVSPFGVSPFGVSPFGVSPFGVSPFGVSPFGVSPFGVSPFGVSPFGVSPFGVSPFGVSPFGVSPFGVSPFGVSPFGVSPFGVSPFGVSGPLNAPFGVSELRELGLAASLVSIPLDDPANVVGGRALGAYTIAEIDSANLLFDLPLQAVFAVEGLVDCTQIDCRQANSFTLGDAVSAGALADTTTLGTLQPALYGLALGDLIGANPAFTEAALQTFVSLIDLTLAEADANPALNLAGVPIQLLDAFNSTTLQEARLLFSGFRLTDLVDLAPGLEEANLTTAVANWAASSDSDETVGDLVRKLPADSPGLASDQLWADTLSVADLAAVDPLLTIDAVWNLLRPLRVEHLRRSDGSPVSLVSNRDVTIGSLVASPTTPGQTPPQRLEGLLWGDLVGSALTEPATAAAGELSVTDVISGFAGVSLGQFLRTAQPITDQQIEALDLAAIDLADYATGDPVGFDIDFSLVAATPDGVRIVASLPDGSRYSEGSATLAQIDGAGVATPVVLGGSLEPATFGDTLVWQITGIAGGADYRLSFETLAVVEVGTVEVAAFGSIDSSADIETATTTIEFVEALEPNDVPGDVGIIAPTSDQLVFSQVSSAGDVDLYRVDAPTGSALAGSRLSVLLTPPAGVDLDLTVVGPPSAPITTPVGQEFETSKSSQNATAAGTVGDAGQYTPPAPLVVLARSARPAGSESITSLPLFENGNGQPLGSYYVAVKGNNGAFSAQAYSLQVDLEPSQLGDECDPTTFPAGTSAFDSGRDASLIADSVDTLFVVNSRRFGLQYGAAAAEQVIDSIDALAADVAPGGALGTLGLDVGILDLAEIPSVATAEAAWDSNPCSVERANDVVRESVSVLNGLYLDPDRSIENVVLVGSDKIIPFARLQDDTLVQFGNEINYAGTFAADQDTPIFAAFAASRFLSDDPYVDPQPSLAGGDVLYRPKFNVGRLVETPAAIVGQIESFVERDGLVRTDSGLATGYEFLRDSALLISDAIDDDPIDGVVGPVPAADVTELIPVDDAVPNQWTAGDLRSAFLPPAGTPPAIASVNGHFSHQGTQSALGSVTDDQTDALFVGDIPGVDDYFAGGVIYSVGCHSGLSVDENIAGPLGRDWPEAFAESGAANYFAQPGFGLGSDVDVKYAEQLALDFTTFLDGNFTVGEAAKLSKNRYFATAGSLSDADKKSGQQAILYGLPFYSLDVENPPARPGAPAPLALVDLGGGLQSSVASFDFEFEGRETVDGTVYEVVGGGADAPEGYPLQPTIALETTATDDSGLVDQHGTVIRSGTVRSVGEINPVYNTPKFDSGGSDEEGLTDAAFPLVPARSVNALLETGQGSITNFQPGQFRPTADGRGEQVLNDAASLQFLYSNSPDWRPPVIDSVNEVILDLGNGEFGLTVTVNTAASEGSAAGAVVAFNPIATAGEGTQPIRSFDLQRSGDDEQLWSGTGVFDGCTTGLRYLVQVYDAAGNVGYFANKLQLDAQCTETGPGDPPAGLSFSVAADPAGPLVNGFYTGPVTVNVTSPGGEFRYRINGGAEQSGTSSFVISESGVQQFSITAPGVQGSADGFVRIDLGGVAPTVDIISPADGSTVAAQSPVTVLFTCSDPSRNTCDGELSTLDDDGVPTVIGPVADTERLRLARGEYRLTVASSDFVTGTTTESIDFTVAAVAPEIRTIAGPETPQEIGTRSTITVDFIDAESDDTFTLAADWGVTSSGESINDLCAAATDNCSITASISDLGDGNFRAEASIVYPKPGVYEVNVVVEDGAGLTDAGLFDFVVIYDPAAGRVTGSGGYWSPAYADGDAGSPWGNPAFFGYTSRYKPGATEPVGETKLNLLGVFSFVSTSYDYLIINDSMAITEGVGRLQGDDTVYRMRVQAIDNPRVDFFQITIKNDVTGETLYDNGVIFDDDGAAIGNENGSAVLGTIRIRAK